MVTLFYTLPPVTEPPIEPAPMLIPVELPPTALTTPADTIPLLGSYGAPEI